MDRGARLIVSARTLEYVHACGELFDVGGSILYNDDSLLESRCLGYVDYINFSTVFLSIAINCIIGDFRRTLLFLLYIV